MAQEEYRLLSNKLKPAIAIPIFILIGLFIFGRPDLNIFETVGAFFVGCLCATVFYFMTRMNMERVDVGLSNVGNPVTVAERYADGYLLLALFFYIFIFAEDYSKRVFWLLALACIPLYFGEALAVVVLERKIGERIIVTHPKGRNILNLLYVVTAVALGMIAAWNKNIP